MALLRVLPLLVALVAAVPVPLAAQENLRIAAVVNDQAITMRDVEARLRLSMLSSEMPDTPETRRRLAPQVLRKLIDERLQIQEAERLKISIGDEEVTQGMARIEAQNRMQPGTFEPFLRSRGIDPATVRHQVRAELGWARVVRRLAGNQLKIGEDEVTNRLEMLQANLGRPEYLVSEIFLSVDNPDQDDEAAKTAERLHEQLQAGAPLPALARQFSQNATAASGGDLGWVGPEQVEPEVAGAIENLTPGVPSKVIRSMSGYHIVVVRNKRIAGQAQRDTTFSLAQVVIAAGSDRKAAADKAARVTREAKSCDDVVRFGKEFGTPDSGRVERVLSSELPPAARSLAEPLKAGEISAPQEVPQGFRVLMVCSRQDQAGQDGLPSRQKISERLEAERVELLSKRFLRDVRRQAFVDVRV